MNVPCAAGRAPGMKGCPRENVAPTAMARTGDDRFHSPRASSHFRFRRKKLSPDQLDRLFDTAKRPDAGLPLYLLVALEELSLFGSYEALTDRIDLLPPTVAELFDQVLSRIEQDHGREMTASICRWIAVSRSGMLESEILDLLTGRDRAFPRARWFRSYRAIEPYMRPVEERTGEGLLAFYHEQLRLAAYRRYLNMRSPEEQPTTDEYRGANGELARHFRSMGSSVPAPERPAMAMAPREPCWRCSKATTDRCQGLWRTKPEGLLFQV